MSRWKPNAADRLAAAALELFVEQGYESTTVVEIAERAGLTKSTFFRYFKDKREVLFGSNGMGALLVEGIESAPASAGPLEAIGHAVELVGREVFPPERRATVRRRRAVIAAHPELQEREALKGLGLVASMVEALRARGATELEAGVAAQLAALALTMALERWTTATTATGEDFAELTRRALDEVSAASSGLVP
jgi:AcrR family transcriptional regulator